MLAIPIIVIHSPLVVGYFPGTGPTTIFIDKQIAHWEAMIFLHPQILNPPYITIDNKTQNTVAIYIGYHFPIGYYCLFSA